MGATSNNGEKRKDSLSGTVVIQSKRLLADLRGGKKVCSAEDIAKYFHQQYIREMLDISVNNIIYDEETASVETEADSTSEVQLQQPSEAEAQSLSLQPITRKAVVNDQCTGT